MATRCCSPAGEHGGVAVQHRLGQGDPPDQLRGGPGPPCFTPQLHGEHAFSRHGEQRGRAGSSGRSPPPVPGGSAPGPSGRVLTPWQSTSPSLGRSSPAISEQQRGLARAGLAHDGVQLPLLKGAGDPLQGLDLLVLGAIGIAHVLQFRMLISSTSFPLREQIHQIDPAHRARSGRSPADSTPQKPAAASHCSAPPEPSRASAPQPSRQPSRHSRACSRKKGPKHLAPGNPQPPASGRVPSAGALTISQEITKPSTATTTSKMGKSSLAEADIAAQALHRLGKGAVPDQHGGAGGPGAAHLAEVMLLSQSRRASRSRAEERAKRQVP